MLFSIIHLLLSWERRSVHSFTVWLSLDNGREQSKLNRSSTGRETKFRQIVWSDSVGDRTHQRLRCPASPTPGSAQARHCPKAASFSARPDRRPHPRDDEAADEILRPEFDPRALCLQVGSSQFLSISSSCFVILVFWWVLIVFAVFLTGFASFFFKFGYVSFVISIYMYNYIRYLIVEADIRYFDDYTMLVNVFSSCDFWCKNHIIVGCG